MGSSQPEWCCKINAPHSYQSRFLDTDRVDELVGPGEYTLGSLDVNGSALPAGALQV